MILHPLFKKSPDIDNTNFKDLKLEPDEIMISFDAVSLFTSIPLDTAKCNTIMSYLLTMTCGNLEET